jgi:hypothetical protein
MSAILQSHQVHAQRYTLQKKPSVSKQANTTQRASMKKRKGDQKTLSSEAMAKGLA